MAVYWKVTADHPVLARPDKYGMNEAEAIAYADSLRSLGYENINRTIEAQWGQTMKCVEQPLLHCIGETCRGYGKHHTGKAAPDIQSASNAGLCCTTESKDMDDGE